MNGPDHYLEAQRLINESRYAADEWPKRASQYLAEAQVHATLALAAATLHSGSNDNGGSGALPDQWWEATR